MCPPEARGMNVPVSNVLGIMDGKLSTDKPGVQVCGRVPERVQYSEFL